MHDTHGTHAARQIHFTGDDFDVLERLDGLVARGQRELEEAVPGRALVLAVQPAAHRVIQAHLRQAKDLDTCTKSINHNNYHIHYCQFINKYKLNFSINNMTCHHINTTV